MQYFFVYILKCSDASYYTGHTDNMEKRISEHNQSKFCGYTSTKLPVEVVFLQHFTTRDEAICAELKIKKWTRAKKELLIYGGWEALINREKK
jgi:predicted GIY-YIG superfamily endonuclease